MKKLVALALAVMMLLGITSAMATGLEEVYANYNPSKGDQGGAISGILSSIINEGGQNTDPNHSVFTNGVVSWQKGAFIGSSARLPKGFRQVLSYREMVEHTYGTFFTDAEWISLMNTTIRDEVVWVSGHYLTNAANLAFAIGGVNYHIDANTAIDVVLPIDYLRYLAAKAKFDANQVLTIGEIALIDKAEEYDALDARVTAAIIELAKSGNVKDGGTGASLIVTDANMSGFVGYIKSQLGTTVTLSFARHVINYVDPVAELKFGEYLNDLIYGELITSERWNTLVPFVLDPTQPLTRAIDTGLTTPAGDPIYRGFTAEEAELVYEIIINNIYAITRWVDGKSGINEFVASLPLPV